MNRGPAQGFFFFRGRRGYSQSRLMQNQMSERREAVCTLRLFASAAKPAVIAPRCIGSDAKVDRQCNRLRRILPRCVSFLQGRHGLNPSLRQLDHARNSPTGWKRCARFQQTVELLPSSNAHRECRTRCKNPFSRWTNIPKTFLLLPLHTRVASRPKGPVSALRVAFDIC